MVKEKGIPGYLKKEWRGSRWRRISRFKMANEMRVEKHWEEAKKKKCRLCGEGGKTWDHI